MSDPNDYKFWYKKAMGAFSSGDASKYLKYALKLNPDHINSWIYYSGFIASGFSNRIFNESNNEIVVETFNEIFKYLGKFEERTDQIPDLIKEILKDPYKNIVISYANCSCSVDTNRSISIKEGLKYCGMWFILAVYYMKVNDLKKGIKAFEKSFSFPRNRSQMILKYYKKLLMENNTDINLSIRNKFSDLIAINDVQKAMGTILPEIKNFNITKNGRKGPHGYILKDDRITKLGINVYDRHENYKKIRFPKIIGFLDALEELKILDTWRLESLPETIGSLSNLKKLELIRCRYFVEMPKNISLLNKLEILNLSECYSLKRLPEEISGLKNLKELNLSECSSLQELPEHIGDLTSLEILNLENCRSLKSIPFSLTQLPNLKVLNLRKCRTLQGIPESISNIVTLNEVSLSGCSRLLELPEKLDFFKHQEKVDLSYCYQLKELPQSVNKLNRLRKLNLHGCRSLLSLPSSIVDLSNLEEERLELLDISDCDSLKSLPKSIINLKELKKLDLTGSFESVPEFIKPTNLIDAIEIQSITSKSNNTPTKDQAYEISPEMLELKKGNPYWSENIKNYQKTIQTQFNFPPEILEENKMHLIKEGVEKKDAETLAKFFITIDMRLDKSEIFKDYEEDLQHDDMEVMHHYRINSQGKVVELHLHHFETCFLWIFPKEICDLENLEVIRLPNNRIEVIQKCVTKLKFLRVLDLSNYSDLGFTDPIIPDSIRSFTQSLESFNQYYD